MTTRKLMTAIALTALACVAALAADEGKPDSESRSSYCLMDKIHGLSALAINSDNESITLTQGKQSNVDMDYNLKNGNGAKKRILVVKVGEEFQVELKDIYKRTYHLEKISDGAASFTYTVKHKKNPEYDGEYHCRVKPFGGK